MTSRFHSTFGDELALTTEEATNPEPRSRRRRRGRGRVVNRGGGDSAVLDAGPASRTTQPQGIHTVDTNQQTAGSCGASASGDPLHVLATEGARALTQALGTEPPHQQLQVAMTPRFHSTFGDELAATTEEATNPQRRSHTGGRRRRGGRRAVHGGRREGSVADAGPASRVTQSVGIDTADMNQQAAQNRDASAWGGGSGGSGSGGSGPSPGLMSVLGQVMAERVAIDARTEDIRGTILQMRNLLQIMQSETNRLNHGASMRGRLSQEYRPVLHHQQRDMDSIQSELHDVSESLHNDLPQEARPELHEYRWRPPSHAFRDLLAEHVAIRAANEEIPRQAPTQTSLGVERMGLLVASERHIQTASRSLHLAARAA